MDQKAHIDFETANALPLPRVGVYRYVQHPSMRVWCMSWAITDQYKRVIKRDCWTPGRGAPTYLLEHIRSGGMVGAHHAAFERAVWQWLREHHPDCMGWPMLPIRQQDCTLSRAAAVGYPLALEKLGSILNCTTQKDMEGNAVMRKMMVASEAPNGWAYHKDWLELLPRLISYCDTDVLAEIEIDGILPALTPHEREVWELDQAINDRGFKIDFQMVNKAVDVVYYAQQCADAMMSILTGGVVKKCTQREQFVNWLQSRGHAVETLRKGDAEDLMILTKEDLFAHWAMRLRFESAKASTSKFEKMLETVCLDDRLRGTVQYHGAHHGRWTGRLVQPQNFRRTDEEKHGDLVRQIASILSENISAPAVLTKLNAIHKEGALDALSLSLRAAIICEIDRKLDGGDFSNIEGRINAWLSGEAWKIQAFIDYDNGIGPDLYRVAYARSFGIRVEDVDGGAKSGPQRQIGKIEELALGFQGSVGAFLNMTQTYFIKIPHITKAVKSVTPNQQWDRVAEDYASARDKHGLGETDWTALKIVVINYRNAHPNMTQSWWDLQDAAIDAVSEPGTICPVYGGRARYVSYDRWLYCQLPSGRVICYPQVELGYVNEDQIEVAPNHWLAVRELDPTLVDLLKNMGAGYQKGRKRLQVTYHKAEGNAWFPAALYGGLQAENIISGTARCILDHAMLRTEAAGYPTILTIHDEILAETIKSHGSAEHFEKLMAEPPPFANGLPITVKAWEDVRYG